MGSNKNCGRCSLPGLNGGVCPVFQKPMEWDESGCPIFQTDVTLCELCGQPVIPTANAILYLTEGGYHSLCGGCSKKISTCVGCQKSASCAFENDPSPIPKYIQRQFQQGKQVVIATVKNEERVKMFCEGKCQCFEEINKKCCREENWCANYLCKWGKEE